MLKIVSWSTGHGFAWIDFLHSFFGVEKLPGIGNHTRAFARGSARLLIPNSEIENEPTRGFLGAYASGVWFSASRRKLRPQTFPPLELATRGLAASSGATPELTRETRVLPQLRSSGLVVAASRERTRACDCRFRPIFPRQKKSEESQSKRSRARLTNLLS